ncbi:MAG: hypothetical protein EXR27_04125 [Betaproteobacteria bacterium]|nr:hypothetical protein [Betaproteobacteria bacterium]
MNNAAGDHCVDVFERADGSFGFEEYRRDHEDGRGWFALHRHGHLYFVCEADALARAKEVVAWLKQGPS